MYHMHRLHVSLKLPWVTKTEFLTTFLRTISSRQVMRIKKNTIRGFTLLHAARNTFKKRSWHNTWDFFLCFYFFFYLFLFFFIFMFSELYKMFSKGLRISLNIFTDMNYVTLKYCYTTKIKHLLHLT